MNVTPTQSGWASRPSRLRDVVSRIECASGFAFVIKSMNNLKTAGITLSTSLKTATAETYTDC